MRTILTALCLAAVCPVAALPTMAQTGLPQIEPETEFPVWGSPDERRAYFEEERTRIAEEQARIEAERLALAEAKAAEDAARLAAAEERRAASRVISPNYGVTYGGVTNGYGRDRVLVCSDARPHPGANTQAPEGNTGVTLRRRAQVEECRWVLRQPQPRRNRNNFVLQFGPDGFSGRIRLGTP